MKLIVFFCLVSLVYCAKKPETPVFLCGRQLAVARVVVCYGAEYVMKRGLSNPMIQGDLHEDQLNEIDWPWSGRHGAVTANWSRYKREGLADECCLNPCTTDVILNYC